MAIHEFDIPPEYDGAEEENPLMGQFLHELEQREFAEVMEQVMKETEGKLRAAISPSDEVHREALQMRKERLMRTVEGEYRKRSRKAMAYFDRVHEACGKGYSAAELASELLWHSHFYTHKDGMDLDGILNAFASYKPFLFEHEDVTEPEANMDTYVEMLAFAHSPDGAAFAELLGRLHAIDETLEGSVHEPEGLPQMEGAAAALPCLDLATGPRGRVYLEHIAQRSTANERQVVLTDMSPFVIGQLQEECALWSLPPDKVQIQKLDVARQLQQLQKQSFGCIQLHNIGGYVECDKDWAKHLTELIHPDGGSIVCTAQMFKAFEMEALTSESYAAFCEHLARDHEEAVLQLRQVHRAVDAAKGAWRIHFGSFDRSGVFLAGRAPRKPRTPFHYPSVVFQRLD